MHVNLRTMTPVLTAYVLSLAPCESIAQQMPTVEQILAKWEERQTKSKSARIRWEQETTRPKGSDSFLRKTVGRRPETANLGTHPPEDHVFTKPHYASFDGNKLRYEFDNQLWRDDKEDSRHVFTFDGETAKILNIRANSFPQGSIRTENHHTEIADIHLRPVLMCFRAVHAEMSPYANSKLQLTGRRSIIAGNECVELLATIRGSAQNHVWVDPSRDCVPVRFVFRYESVDLQRLDVEYQRDQEVGWIPASWSLVVRFKDGSLLESARAKLINFEINRAVPKGEFDPEFPVGSFVLDLKTKGGFIQQPDGQKRIVAHSEIGRPYEELLSTADRSQNRWYVRWPVVLGAAFLAVTAILLALAQRKRCIGRTDGRID